MATINTPRFKFPKSQRLGGKLKFAAVFDHGRRFANGPLVVYILKNEIARPRLGISISRRVGTAVKRNRIKRLLREAFRLGKTAAADGFDYVIVVRPHETKSLAEYEVMLRKLMQVKP